MAQRSIIWAVATLALAFQVHPAAAERRAVLVAIADYAGSRRPLPGPLEMLGELKRTLVEREGFPAANVVTLKDAQATHDAIVQAIESNLIARCRPDDVAVFWFAGHGGQIQDVDGDEEDGLDECLCPYDVDEQPLIDDELAELFGRVPTTNLTVLLDCCHSGTATRSLGLTDPEIVALYRPLPGAGDSRTEAASPSGMGRERLRYVLLTASRADQSAVAVRSSEKGCFLVFTKALLDALAAADQPPSYRRLMDDVRQRIRKWRYIYPGEADVQEPQLEGLDPERPIFAAAPAVSGPGDRVVEVTGDQATVLAAELGDLAPGALVALRDGPAGPVVARARVESASAPYVKVKAIEGTLRVGQVPQVAAIPLPRDRLRVKLMRLSGGAPKAGAPTPEQLAPQLKALDYLELVTGRGACDCVVTPATDGDEANLYLFSPSGGELGSAEALEPLTVLLAREWMIRYGTLLTNPSPGFKVALRDPNAPNPTYRPGQAMSLECRSDRDARVVLLNVSPAGDLSLLVPSPFRPSTALAAGEVLLIPDPAAGVTLVAGTALGPQYVKAVVTLKPLDLPELRPEAKPVHRLRGADAVAFWRRLALALTGGTGLLPADGWATADLLGVVE